MKRRVVTKRRGVEFRGFGSLRLDDPDLQRAIASMGGKAAHAAGTAHSFTKAEAVAAGRKGWTRERRAMMGTRRRIPDAEVAAIRAAYRLNPNCAAIGREFGVSQWYVGDLVNGRCRKTPERSA